MVHRGVDQVGSGENMGMTSDFAIAHNWIKSSSSKRIVTTTRSSAGVAQDTKKVV